MVAQPLLAVPFPLPAGNIGPSFALPLSYWPAVVDQVGFEPITLEGTRAFATLQILAAGIGGSSRVAEPLLYPLSYGGLRHRQESNLRPSVLEVTQAFTTPQTF
ncbi:MAG: hypothetical protein AUI12_08570 [Acidobacteria bacterium 13_2_20CM_2_57_6]|nr:MAG: hypothetical protein AUI12_08570 [Acidobacteria bacterium 13_2_20CM_2_57_6]PYT42425.1 MAG: hypothetical protein DMG45_09745 [Acidobacteriota bacterium]PYT45825.1 MAG: hypothetical protein DMG47_07030 [Acidobacteriota bacterium]